MIRFNIDQTELVNSLDKYAFLFIRNLSYQGIGQHVGFVNHAVCPTLQTVDQKEAFINLLFQGPDGKLGEAEGQERHGEKTIVPVGSEHPLEYILGLV